MFYSFLYCEVSDSDRRVPSFVFFVQGPRGVDFANDLSAGFCDADRYWQELAYWDMASGVGFREVWIITWCFILNSACHHCDLRSKLLWWITLSLWSHRRKNFRFLVTFELCIIMVEYHYWLTTHIWLYFAHSVVLTLALKARIKILTNNYIWLFVRVWWHYNLRLNFISWIVFARMVKCSRFLINVIIHAKFARMVHVSFRFDKRTLGE
jgi:hypothetical protein